MTQSGGTTTTTASYGGIAESVNGALSYLLSDGLGSVSEAVSTAGTVSATQLYAPYGGVRYQSGTVPTDKGYTGQVSDAASTGLDYYGARYYDPVAGQFTSADTTLAGGLNEYAYVGGNPETRIDPTGHHYTCPAGGCGGATSGSSGGSSSSSSPAKNSSPSKDCQSSDYLCRIAQVFHDPQTQQVLDYIAKSGSKIGLELLQFMLLVGAKVGGDRYITWRTAQTISQAVGRSASADSDGWTRFIALSNELLTDDSTLRTAAATLIHEATESYFEIELGIHWGGMGSQRGDYVAQWFAGEFEKQAVGSEAYGPDNGPNGSQQQHDYRAYQLTFDQWTKSSDFVGRTYAQEFPFAWEVAPLGILPSPRGPYFVSGSTWVGPYDIPELDGKLVDLVWP